MEVIGQLEIIGDPPDLEGLICEAFICQSFVCKGELVTTANGAYLRFAGLWRQLNIDCGVVFWRTPTEDPAPWAVEEEGWEYPHTDVGEIAGVTGRRLERCQMEATPSGARVAFRFENGRTIVIEDENDNCSFRIE